MTQEMAATTLSRVDDDERPRADAISARRDRHGMTDADLAEHAHVDRGKLGRFLRGEYRVDEKPPSDRWIGKVERALDDYEAETGSDGSASRDPHVIDIEISGDFGVRIVVKGLIEDRAELEASALRLARNMRGDAPPEG